MFSDRIAKPGWHQVDRDRKKKRFRLTHRPPLVGQTFAFEDLPQALRLFQSGQTTGKVIIRVGGDDDGE